MVTNTPSNCPWPTIMPPTIATIIPSPKPLLVWLTGRLTDEMLLQIAYLDYGNDADVHFTALSRIRDTATLPKRLDWEPGEVLRLARGFSAGQRSYNNGPPATAAEAALMRVFANALLLAAHSMPGHAATGIQPSNMNLCCLLRDLKVFGAEALVPATRFVAAIGSHWARGMGARAFFGVAILWLVLRNRDAFSEVDLAELTAWTIEDEAYELAVQWGGREVGVAGRWLLRATTNPHSARCWEKIGADLRGLANDCLGGREQADVLHIANLMAP